LLSSARMIAERGPHETTRRRKECAGLARFSLDEG
jgi:hypothetical protein